MANQLVSSHYAVLGLPSGALPIEQSWEDAGSWEILPLPSRGAFQADYTAKPSPLSMS